MSQRDWVFVFVIVLSLGLAALIGYGLWRGRNAAAHDGDGDAFWSFVLRFEAIGLSIVVLAFLGLAFLLF